MLQQQFLLAASCSCCEVLGAGAGWLVEQQPWEDRCCCWRAKRLLQLLVLAPCTTWLLLLLRLLQLRRRRRCRLQALQSWLL